MERIEEEGMVTSQLLGEATDTNIGGSSLNTTLKRPLNDSDTDPSSSVKKLRVDGPSTSPVTTNNFEYSDDVKAASAVLTHVANSNAVPVVAPLPVTSEYHLHSVGQVPPSLIPANPAPYVTNSSQFINRSQPSFLNSSNAIMGNGFNSLGEGGMGVMGHVYNQSGFQPTLTLTVPYNLMSQNFMNGDVINASLNQWPDIPVQLQMQQMPMAPWFNHLSSGVAPGPAYPQFTTQRSFMDNPMLNPSMYGGLNPLNHASLYGANPIMTVNVAIPNATLAPAGVMMSGGHSLGGGGAPVVPGITLEGQVVPHIVGAHDDSHRSDTVYKMMSQIGMIPGESLPSVATSPGGRYSHHHHADDDGRSKGFGDNTYSDLVVNVETIVRMRHKDLQNALKNRNVIMDGSRSDLLHRLAEIEGIALPASSKEDTGISRVIHGEQNHRVATARYHSVAVNAESIVSMKYKDLQNALKKRNLSGYGSRSELLLRLAEAEGISLPASSHEGFHGMSGTKRNPSRLAASNAAIVDTDSASETSIGGEGLVPLHEHKYFNGVNGRKSSFYCPYCKYDTTKRQNIDKHITTQRHLTNEAHALSNSAGNV